MARCTSLKRLRQMEDNLVNESARVLFMIFCFVFVFAPKSLEEGIVLVGVLWCFLAILVMPSLVWTEGEENEVKKVVKREENVVKEAVRKEENLLKEAVKKTVSSCSNLPEGDSQRSWEYSEFHEAHERSLKASMIKVSAMLLFMISSFVAIFTAGSPQAPLYSFSLANLKTPVRIPGIVYIVLKDLRMRVRVPGIVYTVLQSVDRVHCALGFAVVLVIGAVMYFSSRKKQSRGVFSSVQENATEEAQAEMECENDVVVKPSVRTCSNHPEASPQIWKPISELNVKLELEYSTITDATQVFEGESRRKSMSTITHSVVKQDSSVGSSSSCDRSRSIECKVEPPLRRSSRIHNKVTSQYSVGEMSSSEKMSSSTHSVLKPESSVGSFSSFHRSSECKAKVPLRRRSTRIRNKVIAEECKVEAPGKKIMSRECNAEVAVRRSRRIHNVKSQPSATDNMKRMIRL